MAKNRIRLTESQLHHIIKESVRRILNEAIPSTQLSQIVSKHGGIDKEGSSPQGLGNITDDQISYVEEYPSYAEAVNAKNQYTRSNYGRRSDADMQYFFYVYKMADGSAALVAMDRSKTETSPSWGGETFKKTADKSFAYEHEPRGWEGYHDDSDTYYYGVDTNMGQPSSRNSKPSDFVGVHPRRSVANDFGIHTSKDFRGRRNDLENSRQRYHDTYGRGKGEEEWQQRRNADYDHMRDYVGRHYPNQLRNR